MGQTATSTVGYGFKIDVERFIEATGRGHYGYHDEYLDENLYPELTVGIEGYGSDALHSQGKWLFIKTGLSRIYTGISGDGMNKNVKFSHDPDALLPGILQLEEWKRKHNHEGIMPSWNHIVYFN